MINNGERSEHGDEKEFARQEEFFQPDTPNDFREEQPVGYTVQ